MKILICTVLAAASAQPVFACDFCAIYAATEAHGESGKGFLAGVASQYTYFNTFQSGGHDEANPDAEYINSVISQLFVGYNFNNRVGVQFNLPVIYRDYGKTGAHGNESGIGDVSLIGNFRVWRKRTEDFTFNWSVTGGVKFPTGDSSQLNPALEEFAEGIGGHDLALGSGSVDGLVGTEVLFRYRKVFLTAGLQYAIRSEGDFDYQYANELSWSGGPGVYLALQDNYTISLQAIVSGETKGQDTVNGAELDDTSVTSVYLGPQINFTWGSRLSAQAGAELPVSIVSTGNQLVPNYRVRAALTLRF
jgi:hypothetical protein